MRRFDTDFAIGPGLPNYQVRHFESDVYAVSPFPWPGAAVDLDFRRRRYWWGGAAKLEADFASFVVTDSTFGPYGLVPGANIDVRLVMATVGITIPGAFGIGFRHNAGGAAQRSLMQLDSGAETNRVAAWQNTTPAVQLPVTSGNVAQANLALAGATYVGPKLGVAFSVDTNDVRGCSAGSSVVSDTAATLPVGLTTMRIGRQIAAATQCNAHIARVVFFAAVKTSPELLGLAAALRADN